MASRDEQLLMAVEFLEREGLFRIQVVEDCCAIGEFSAEIRRKVG